jgi:hypothetical protein
MSFYNCEYCDKQYDPERNYQIIYPKDYEEHFCSLICLINHAKMLEINFNNLKNKGDINVRDTKN